jgi:organic hydroperoxide reductase OsmC/OhrA
MVLVAAKRRLKLPDDLEISADVTFGRDPEDGLFVLSADLKVGLSSLTGEEADRLIAETQAICPYAKMARQGIKHTVQRK